MNISKPCCSLFPKIFFYKFYFIFRISPHMHQYFGTCQLFVLVTFTPFITQSFLFVGFHARCAQVVISTRMLQHAISLEYEFTYIYTHIVENVCNNCPKISLWFSNHELIPNFKNLLLNCCFLELIFIRGYELTYALYICVHIYI